MSDNEQLNHEQVSAADQIRLAAYYKWINAGCPADRQLDFWCEAEREYLANEKDAACPSQDIHAEHHDLIVRPKALPAPVRPAASGTRSAARR